MGLPIATGTMSLGASGSGMASRSLLPPSDRKRLVHPDTVQNLHPNVSASDFVCSLDAVPASEESGSRERSFSMALTASVWTVSSLVTDPFRGTAKRGDVARGPPFLRDNHTVTD